MARRRRSSTLPNAHPAVIARPSFRLFRVPSALSSYRAALSLLEDRRLYHPLGPFRPALGSPRRAARVVVRPARAARARGIRPDVFRFADPRRVLVCVRRHERREVLFAKRRLSGGGGAKRRNFWSSISCR